MIEDDSDPKYVVYGLHLGDNVIRYVGQTIRGRKHRLKTHIKEMMQGSTLPVHNWIRKNGANITSSVLDYIDEEDRPQLHAIERFWIAQLRSIGQADLNLTDGGEGQLGSLRTVEQRKKMSDSQKKYFSTHKGTFLGRKHSKETRELIRSKALGRTLSAETRLKLGLASKGKYSNENHWRTSLTNQQVAEMKTLMIFGYRNFEIARIYDVNSTTVSNIRRGIAWREIEHR